MNLYIVGGFLGSGKTTAIVEAAKLIIAKNKVVGIVTNDQGKYLVDTAFVRAEGIPVVEVTGGCFCCHYDDFDKVLSGLKVKLAPDTIFAESVGSCADIISTVLNPLLKYKPKEIAHSVLTVFTDIRFFQAKMKGEDLPFSEEVNYIFEEQIEEAGILILNKKDYLSDVEGGTLLKEAKEKYPQKIVLLQNSFVRKDIENWLECLSRFQPVSPLKGLNLDYDKYSKGEAQLAWLDAKIDFCSKESVDWNELLLRFLETLIRNVQNHSTIAHLKCELVSGMQYHKISVTSFQEKWTRQPIEAFVGRQVSILLNIRTEAQPDVLRNQFRNTVNELKLPADVKLDIAFENAFTPSKPSPKHHVP
jgi:G3E family GTPase